MEPFRVDVPDKVLGDLRTHLKLTHWADDFANEGWQYGTSTAYLKELVGCWTDGYEWRKQERAMNAYPQFRTESDGVPIHFIHVLGEGPVGISVLPDEICSAPTPLGAALLQPQAVSTSPQRGTLRGLGRTAGHRHERPRFLPRVELTPIFSSIDCGPVFSGGARIKWQPVRRAPER